MTPDSQPRVTQERVGARRRTLAGAAVLAGEPGVVRVARSAEPDPDQDEPGSWVSGPRGEFTLCSTGFQVDHKSINYPIYRDIWRHLLK